MRLGAVLYVYKGEWNLPSIDFECLRVLCLIKFTRCPVTIEINGNPFSSGAGKLPYLEIGNEKFIGYRNIKNLLDREHYAIDSKLDEKSKQISTVFTNWVFTNLHGYYHYFMYGDPNNFEITRTLYAKRTPFPFNFYYPSSYQKEANDIVQIMGNFDINDKQEASLQSLYFVTNAKKCVNVLSKRLGRKVWFFGDNFSEFDAIVYSYLAIIYKISLPNNPLKNHIKACQNLINFINRISRDIFQKEAFNSGDTPKGDASPNDPMITGKKRKHRDSEKKTKILAGVGAAMAMTTFAIWRGLIRPFSYAPKYYEKSGYDDDDDDDNDDENME